MRRFTVLAILISTVGFAIPAYAQFADDNVLSDSAANTGVGGGALYNLNSMNDPSCTVTSPPVCAGNTAVGYGPLLKITTGNWNTAVGADALLEDTTGSYNTAIGVSALYENNGTANTGTGYEALYGNQTGSGLTGDDNTATGYEALYADSSGADNTANGYEALYANTTGGYNTASGAGALNANSTGGYNTASGASALLSNTKGSYNTASGTNALNYNNTGNYNTASGASALYTNSTADYNTASGYGALYTNNGNSNSASGYEALYANTSGADNTAIGVHALASNTSGSNNIGVGYHGGISLTTGSNNIDIGNPGAAADGTATDSGVIRIGTTLPTQLQTTTYIAGIYGVKTATTGTAVFIDSSGQLGTVSSSIRYKEDVQPMAGASERLLKLRPVRFRYKKADALGEKPIQYGLIAEEVADVYPELVVRDATTGQIDGVRYDELAPMLLNEMQKKNAAQDARIRDLEQQVAEMHAALLKLQSKDERIAQR